MTNLLATGVLAAPEVLPKPNVDTYNKKQAPLVYSGLSVKKLKLVGDLVYHYTGVRRALTKENMTYVMLKDYNDYLKSISESESFEKGPGYQANAFYYQNSGSLLVQSCWYLF